MFSYCMHDLEASNGSKNRFSGTFRGLGHLIFAPKLAIFDITIRFTYVLTKFLLLSVMKCQKLYSPLTETDFHQSNRQLRSEIGPIYITMNNNVKLTRIQMWNTYTLSKNMAPGVHPESLPQGVMSGCWGQPPTPTGSVPQGQVQNSIQIKSSGFWPISLNLFPPPWN